MEETGGLCYYCGEEAIVPDHIIPWSYGGSDDISNLIASCHRCNRLLHNKVFDTLLERSNYVREELRRRGLPIGLPQVAPSKVAAKSRPHRHIRPELLEVEHEEVVEKQQVVAPKQRKQYKRTRPYKRIGQNRHRDGIPIVCIDCGLLKKPEEYPQSGERCLHCCLELTLARLPGQRGKFSDS